MSSAERKISPAIDRWFLPLRRDLDQLLIDNDLGAVTFDVRPTSPTHGVSAMHKQVSAPLDPMTGMVVGQLDSE